MRITGITSLHLGPLYVKSISCQNAGGTYWVELNSHEVVFHCETHSHAERLAALLREIACLDSEEPLPAPLSESAATPDEEHARAEQPQEQEELEP